MLEDAHNVPDRETSIPVDQNPLEKNGNKNSIKVDVMPKLRVHLAETEEDLQRAVDLSEIVHEESFFAHIPFSREKSLAMARLTQEKPVSNGLLVAKSGDVMIGFCLFTAGEYYVGTDTLVTTVLCLYVHKGWRGTPLGGKAALRLINGVKKWSDQRDVTHITIHSTAGIETQKTDKLLRRLGFKTLGGNYVG